MTFDMNLFHTEIFAENFHELLFTNVGVLTIGRWRLNEKCLANKVLDSGESR